MANDDQSEVDMVCRMETITKSFFIKIIGYSLIKQIELKSDMVVGTFDFEGHKWAIKFWPDSPPNTWLNLQISLLTETKMVMCLEVEYSLLDHKSGTYSVAELHSTKSYGKVWKQGDKLEIPVFIKIEKFEKSDYLKDDCFMLKCSVKLVKPLLVEPRKKSVIVPSSDFVQHFHQFWDSREGADVVLQVGEETFYAHQIVLAARSPVFKAEFFGPMLESKTDCVKIEGIKPLFGPILERKTDCVKIEGIKPEVFKLMLQFVYTDTIPPNEELPFEMAQHLLVAADRYGLVRLKLICEEKLIDSIDVENASAILVISDKYNCDQLKEICLDFVISGKNLQAVMATDGFKHLMETCPILGDLLEKVDRKRTM